MPVIMKHDRHGHCFAYSAAEIARLRELGWYEKPTEQPKPEPTKKPAKSRRK